jgi:polygalacturonase
MGKYRSLGTLFNRVFRNDLNANFDDVDADINAQKTRVDNLITGTPQPSEVVDARGTFSILRDRLNAVDTDLVGKGGRLDGIDTSLAGKVGKGELFINVRDYGAKGDGVTDDSTSIKNAVNYLVSGGGGTLLFPFGTYKCNAVLGNFAGSNITIELNGSTLDFTSLSVSTATTLLQFSGSYSTGVSLSVDSAKGSKTIQTNTSGFSVGDMVRIYSNKVWDPARTSTRVGEIGYIRSVDSSTQMTLTIPLSDGYAVSDSAKVEKLVPVKNVNIQNGTIVGPSGNDQLQGIVIQLGVNCLVRNIKSYDIDMKHLVFIDCVKSNIESCFFYESNHATMAYGVSFQDASQDCICSNCHFTDVRHSMTTNNAVSTSYGITRRIKFTNNTVSSSVPNIGDGAGGDAIDTHAGAEDIFIVNNTVNGSSGHGINMECRSGVVLNNKINNTNNYGINIASYCSIYDSAFVVENNYFGAKIGDASGSDYGINVSLVAASGNNYIISGNRVNALNQGIRVIGTSTYKGKHFNIANNTVTNTTATNAGIQVEYCDGVVINANNNKCQDVGYLIRYSNNAAINGNQAELTGSGSNGWGIRVENSDYAAVNGNALVCNGSQTTKVGVTFGLGNVNNSGVFGNITQGFATSVSLNGGTGNLSANNI